MSKLFLLALLCAASLTACGGSADQEEGQFVTADYPTNGKKGPMGGAFNESTQQPRK